MATKMPLMPTDATLRKNFREWISDVIKAETNHPLACLVEDGKLKYDGRYSLDTSVDAGHTTSKWTGKFPFLAVELTSNNQFYNSGESNGCYYEKPAVVIKGVPVEVKTAIDLERAGRIPRGTVGNAEPTKGARYDPATGSFILDKITLARPAGIPKFPVETGTLKTRSQNFLQNQDSVAMLGMYLGGLSTWLNDWGIERNVKKEIDTTLATQISEIHARGEGALIIARIQSHMRPDVFPERSIVGISVSGGASPQEALRKWRDKPKYLAAPPSLEWEIDEEYSWLTPGGDTKASAATPGNSQATPATGP